MPLSKVALTAFVALITMVNPLAVLPSFIAMTDGTTRGVRGKIAAIAGLGTVTVLILFLFAGNWLFGFFGITLPAFQIMGGIIFFTNALRTLVDDEHTFRNLRKNPHMEEELNPTRAVDPTSIAIVPLAIPMLSGPGAITSTMLLVNLYPQLDQKLAIIGAIATVGLIVYITLLAAVPISHVLGERGRAVFTKVMALLLGAIGVQFVLNGVKPLIVDIVKAAG